MTDTVHIPGQGCGCSLCKQPVPEPPFERTKGAMKNMAYSAARKAYAESIGQPWPETNPKGIRP
jgi:hypothetical protein